VGVGGRRCERGTYEKKSSLLLGKASPFLQGRGRGVLEGETSSFFASSVAPGKTRWGGSALRVGGISPTSKNGKRGKGST